jgi:uncharacterized protein
MHRQQLSRSRMRGGRLHRWFGDGVVSKALWQPTRGSLARAWLVGFPITIVPFLPAQSVFACIAALLVRGNLLLCIALQFLSTPLTAPVHLPACYFVGEVARGESPGKVWKQAWNEPKILVSAHAVTSLYLGAAIIGIAGGVIGYAVILRTWSDRPRRKGGLPPSDESMPPFRPTRHRKRSV